MTQLELVMRVAWSFLGKPYLWGGDDPMAGFDCSGFVIECLKSAGLLPRDGDWTAAALKERFKSVAMPRPGCLVFWANAQGKIVHVELCLDAEYSIGASGGGSRTLTVADAIAQNAYIKVRPMKTRGGIAGYCDPFVA